VAVAGAGPMIRTGYTFIGWNTASGGRGQCARQDRIGGIMKTKYIIPFLAFLLINPLLMNGQEVKKTDGSSFFSLHLTPGIDVPLGESADYFKLGGSMGLSGEYALSDQPLFFLSGGIDYNLAPIQAEKSLSIFAGGAGGGIYYDLSPRLSLKVSVSGGY